MVSRHQCGCSKTSLVLLVDRAHKRCSGRKDVVHKDEDCLLRCELDPFPGGSIFVRPGSCERLDVGGLVTSHGTDLMT